MSTKEPKEPQMRGPEDLVAKEIPDKLNEAPRNPEQQVEDGVIRAAEIIDAVEGEGAVLTEGEFKKVQGLRAKLLELARTSVKTISNVPGQELRLMLDADHSEASDEEIKFLHNFIKEDPNFSIEVAEDKKYYIEQLARLLYELHRNEDYYRSHPNTVWEVGSTVVRIPIEERTGAFRTFKEVGEKYATYTRVRAQEASKVEPDAEGIDLQYDQRKGSTPRLFRSFAKLSTMSTDPHGDALEPIFGLPLPKSPKFNTRAEAEEFAKDQYALIEDLTKAVYPGRIQVLKKGGKESQT